MDDWLKDLCEEYPELLLADGFDEAVIGLVDGACREPVLCYDYRKCIEILSRKMSEEDADEYMQFNVVGAYVGEYTPLFVHDLRRKTKKGRNAQIRRTGESEQLLESRRRRRTDLRPART